MIRRLCTEEAAGAQLTDKLTENLQEILCHNEVTLAIIIKSVMLVSSHDESANPWRGLDAGRAHKYDSAVCFSPWKLSTWLCPHAKQERSIQYGLWHL